MGVGSRIFYQSKSRHRKTEHPPGWGTLLSLAAQAASSRGTGNAQQSSASSLILCVVCWICTCHGFRFLQPTTWKRSCPSLASAASLTWKLTYRELWGSSTTCNPGTDRRIGSSRQPLGALGVFGKSGLQKNQCQYQRTTLNLLYDLSLPCVP